MQFVIIKKREESPMVSPFFERQLFNNHPKTDGPMGYNRYRKK